jgi:hypothetical protein
VLGSRFLELAPIVRAFHAGAQAMKARGVFSVEHGASWLARLIVWILRFPPAGERVDLALVVEPTAAGERWSRSFGGVALVSEQWQKGGHLIERLGNNEITFALLAEAGALVFQQVRVRMVLGPVGLPMPAILAPKVSARVVDDGGVMRSEIRVELPVLGLLIRYGGRLEAER